jgi:choline monooxygenase
VLPLGPHRTLTVFDYWFDSACDDAFIRRSIEASDRVQQEDVAICEAVQRGLASSGFDRGPYAPNVERADHEFHRMLARDLDVGPTP